jgi:hypothetical protein
LVTGSIHKLFEGVHERGVWLEDWTNTLCIAEKPH